MQLASTTGFYCFQRWKSKFPRKRNRDRRELLPPACVTTTGNAGKYHTPSCDIREAIDIQLAKMPAFPLPIDSSYVPSTSITKIAATAPIDDMIAILERDGGLILTNLVSSQDITAVNSELEPYIQKARAETHAAYDLVPKQTIMVPGVVGKSPTMVKIAEFEVIDTLRTLILQKKCTATWEDRTEEFTIGPLLNSSLTYHMSHGAPRQRLHRDDMIHGVYHGGEYSLSNETMLGFMIAGSKTTRENGATMAIPGSHKWDHSRVPKADEVCFAGKSDSLSLHVTNNSRLGITFSFGKLLMDIII